MFGPSIFVHLLTSNGCVALMGLMGLRKQAITFVHFIAKMDDIALIEAVCQFKL